MDNFLKTKQSGCRWLEGNDLRRHDAPWRHWPFIYEHHKRVPMLLSVTFDEIATLIWNFCWAHQFVARWIRYGCVYFYLWPFQFVAVQVCGRFCLWPFRSVAVSVCGRFGLWPFRSVAFPVCGRFSLWPFRFWPFRFVTVMTRILIYDTCFVRRRNGGRQRNQPIRPTSCSTCMGTDLSF